MAYKELLQVYWLYWKRWYIMKLHQSWHLATLFFCNISSPTIRTGSNIIYDSHKTILRCGISLYVYELKYRQFNYNHASHLHRYKWDFRPLHFRKAMKSYKVPVYLTNIDRPTTYILCVNDNVSGEIMKRKIIPMI